MLCTQQAEKNWTPLRLTFFALVYLHCSTNAFILLLYFSFEFQIEDDNLGTYFETCWLEKPELWANLFRDELLTMDSDTNNLIERWHKTMKRFLGLNNRFPVVIKRLHDLSQ